MRPHRHVRCMIAALAAFTIVSCRLEVPVREMAQAKSTITRAHEVKAHKYAPDELKKATDHLMSSHRFAAAGDKGAATDTALKSLSFANTAVAKSLPLLSKDSLDAATAKVNEAASLADPAAKPSELVDAEQKLARAGQLHSESKFWESYLISKDIAPALDGFIGKQSEDLKQSAAQRLEAAQNALRTCRAAGPDDSQKADIDKAAALIDKAGNALSSGAYKDSIAASDEAISILNAATIAMEKKREAKIIDTKKEKELTEKTDTDRRTYKVVYNPKKRDCLWRIALKMYKNPRLWPLIYVANKDKIKDPDLIYPGQVFIIPPVPSKKPSADQKTDGESDDDDEGDDTESVDETNATDKSTDPADKKPSDKTETPSPKKNSPADATDAPEDYSDEDAP